MRAEYFTPTEKIADFVDSVLVIEINDIKNTFSLPLFANGKPNLLFQSAKGIINGDSNYLTLFGQTILPEEITFKSNFTLIAYFFKPFILNSLFGVSAQELTDNPTNLNLIDNHNANVLKEKLLHAPDAGQMMAILNDFIYSRMQRLTSKNNSDNRTIKHAIKLISESPTKDILKKAQAELHVTERTLQRMFVNNIGISPNQYRRIVQFDSAFQQLNRGQFELLSDIAFNNDFSDQSHFIRSFKEFTHMTPKQYLSLGQSQRR